MDVCGENGWTDGYCHPGRVRGCCTWLLSKSQSHYCANIFLHAQFLLLLILVHAGSERLPKELQEF